VCAATQTSADDDVLRRFHDEMHDPIAKEVLDRLVTELWARHEAVHDMLRRLDKSGSGCLSKSDLRMGLQSMHLKLTPNELDSVIRLFDKDGSGMVDYVNFYHVLTKYQAEKRHRFAQDVPPLYNRNALDGISNAEVFIRDPALYAKLQSARVCEAQLGRGPRTQAEVIEALVAERVAAETAKLRAELEAKYEASRLQAELADLKLKVTHSLQAPRPPTFPFAASDVRRCTATLPRLLRASIRSATIIGPVAGPAVRRWRRRPPGDGREQRRGRARARQGPGGRCTAGNAGRVTLRTRAGEVRPSPTAAEFRASGLPRAQRHWPTVGARLRGRDLRWGTGGTVECAE